MLKQSFGIKTHLGRVKEYNSDAVIDFAIDNGHVFVVCDGHDGENGNGSLAARLTADSIKKYFSNRNYKDIAKALTNAITFANYTVNEQKQKDPRCVGMASTIAVLINYENKVYYAYAGDSRIAIFKNNKLTQLTKDHLSNNNNPFEAEVTNMVGLNPEIKFGVCRTPVDVADNDIFLLSTDGLTDIVSPIEISQILDDDNTSAEHKCQLLIDRANQNGGDDNISVAVIEFHNITNNKKTIKISKKTIKTIFTVLALLAIAFSAYLTVKWFVNKEPEQPLIINNSTNSQQNNNDNEYTELLKKEKEIGEKIKTDKTKVTVTKVEGTLYDYKIEPGDNLYRIAIRFGVTQKQLTELNGTKAENLKVGAILNIPIRCIHTVTSGESYSLICDKYIIEKKRIGQANNINTSLPLKVGQELVIPVK